MLFHRTKILHPFSYHSFQLVISFLSPLSICYFFWYIPSSWRTSFAPRARLSCLHIPRCKIGVNTNKVHWSSSTSTTTKTYTACMTRKHHHRPFRLSVRLSVRPPPPELGSNLIHSPAISFSFPPHSHPPPFFLLKTPLVLFHFFQFSRNSENHFSSSPFFVFPRFPPTPFFSTFAISSLSCLLHLPSFISSPLMIVSIMYWWHGAEGDIAFSTSPNLYFDSCLAFLVACVMVCSLFLTFQPCASCNLSRFLVVYMFALIYMFSLFLTACFVHLFFWLVLFLLVVFVFAHLSPFNPSLGMYLSALIVFDLPFFSAHGVSIAACP